MSLASLASGSLPVEKNTGDLYGSIWDLMSETSFQELSDLHWVKFRASGLGDQFLQGKTCLDAGCGSGRAVRSMLLEGAAHVEAVDIGDECIANTWRRNRQAGDRLRVSKASVLTLPFADNTFDFVHCDGVLHHTIDPLRGFFELVRVAKPGAPIMFGLYGAGGVLNVGIYSCRAFNRFLPRTWALRLLRLFTADPIKHYVFLDPFYVPIRKKYRPHHIEAWARCAEVDGLRRIKYRTHYQGWDRILKDYSSLGPWFCGVGYLMYVGFKSAVPAERAEQPQRVDLPPEPIPRSSAHARETRLFTSGRP